MFANDVVPLEEAVAGFDLVRAAAGTNRPRRSMGAIRLRITDFVFAAVDGLLQGGLGLVKLVVEAGASGVEPRQVVNEAAPDRGGRRGKCIQGSAGLGNGPDDFGAASNGS